MENIDENLYSRQIAVYGKNAMKSLTNSNVLILGFNGACLELCKNLVLNGISKINLVTDDIINVDSLCTNYYASEKDLGKNVTDVILAKISELNPYVNFLSDKDYKLKDYDTVILVNTNITDAIKINNLCRQQNINFIWMNYYGLFSNVFCDFGNEFIINDIDGEPNNTALLQEITKDGLFICIENEKHNLSPGNKFNLTEVIGINNSSFTVKEVISDISFTVQENCKWSDYKSSGRITSLKDSVVMKFESLEDQIEEPNIVNFDTDSQDLHKLFLKLTSYINQFEELPEMWSSEYDVIFDVESKYSKLFHNTCRGSFLPVCSIIGSYTAQECIKSLTKKYTPINQWFYYHCFDILPDGLDVNCIDDIKGDKYDGMRYIFGDKLLNDIRDKSIFIVGSGAIGCEHLKNFAMTGFGTRSSKIVVTDMDTIEKSNLNRQFLFRNKDIGRLKSEIAAREAVKMNNDVNIEAKYIKVCNETETEYGKDFFNSIHCVANALDNVQARLYVDKRCIFFDKPLFESGTLGTKGNVQTIIPRISEHYGASQDQQEKSFPVCTIKNFPNSIEHTIHWARDDFEELFTNMPNDWNRYIKNPNVIESMSPNEKGEFINNINYMWSYKPKNFNSCVIWAIERFYDKFNHQIKQLLHSYPKDTSTSVGSNFWSGGKRCPDEIDLDISSVLHNEYIYHTSILLAQMFNITLPDNISDICLDKQNKYEHKTFIASDNVKTAANDEEEKEMEKNRFIDIDGSNLPNSKELKEYLVNSIEFEKDDDNNHHIDYITATSNLRAVNYKIDPTDKYNTKLIAGKIIPAISTTTSIVSGLVIIEIIKHILGKNKLQEFKNTFINLALGLTLQSEPMPSICNKINSKSYTPWDYYEINQNILIEDLFKSLSKEYGSEIDTIMYGSKMLISPMTSLKEKSKRIKMRLSELLESFGINIIHDTIYELQISSLFDDDDVDLPNIKFNYLKDEETNLNLTV